MTSHRQIFRSSAIIGGATVINIVIGIVKVKVLAVLLGPAGVGLMGLYQNIVGLAPTLAGGGLGTSGGGQFGPCLFTIRRRRRRISGRFRGAPAP